MIKIILSERQNGEWDYRFVAQNGNLLVHSEGYDSKGNAKRAATSFLDSIQTFLLEGNSEYSLIYSDGKEEAINEGL